MQHTSLITNIHKEEESAINSKHQIIFSEKANIAKLVATFEKRNSSSETQPPSFRINQLNTNAALS